MQHLLSKKLQQRLKSNLSKTKILVVGDVMLDRYWFGDANRISPEAPVPIAKIERIENRPGGAANVARNIASLGGMVSLLSVVGSDEAAETLHQLLNQEHVDVIFKTDTTINTIIKLRVLARNQQLIRLDFEDIPSHEILAELTDTYANIIADYDLIILSDYGKGGLNHTAQMIKLAKQANKPILIDPKGNDYSKYTGATLLTPNRQEFSNVMGSWHTEDELQHKAQRLCQQLQLDALLITRSEDGMSLFSKNKVINYPTVAHEVYDVSGAGDTVIATLGLMLASNFDLEDAVLIANLAAGIVVGKVGTATVSKTELLDLCMHQA